MTKTIIIDAKLDGVLLPLRELVRRMPIAYAKTIRLRDFRLHFGQPLGLATIDFENRTKTVEGIILDNESFLRFAYTNMQIIDGSIEVVIKLLHGEVLLLVECIDATRWEFSSESSEVLDLIALG